MKELTQKALLGGETQRGGGLFSPAKNLKGGVRYEAGKVAGNL
jgi:hypothetical protein